MSFADYMAMQSHYVQIVARRRKISALAAAELVSPAFRAMYQGLLVIAPLPDKGAADERSAA